MCDFAWCHHFFASRLDNLHLPFANVKQHLQKEHFCLVTAELITTKLFPLMLVCKNTLRQIKMGSLIKNISLIKVHLYLICITLILPLICRLFETLSFSSKFVNRFFFWKTPQQLSTLYSDWFVWKTVKSPRSFSLMLLMSDPFFE